MDATGQDSLAVVSVSGIGAATARLIAARRRRLAIIDRNLDAVRATAADLHAGAFHGDAAATPRVAHQIDATLAPSNAASRPAPGA